MAERRFLAGALVCARSPARFFGAATGWESPLGGRVVRAIERLLRVVAAFLRPVVVGSPGSQTPPTIVGVTSL